MVMGTLTKYSHMFKVQKRDKKRASTELGSEAFMILSRKVKKQSSKVQAVEDENGNIITDRIKLEEAVLDSVTKIFEGQGAKIFEHRGEQLISAVYIKTHFDQEEWIKNKFSANTFEKCVHRSLSLK